MQTLIFSIRPRTAFGTYPKGDTLFGQLCWTVLRHHGEECLRDLLAGYVEGNPFMVVSDAFPAGFLPRPALPAHWLDQAKDADRKAIKKQIWLPIDRFPDPIHSWLTRCQPATGALGINDEPQPHNTIDRGTGTTGTGPFAPYAMSQLWFGDSDSRDILLDLYIVLDESRLDRAKARELLESMGLSGFGRDASIGLGKFEVEDCRVSILAPQPDSNAWLTLAPCAPQGMPWQEERCFYLPFTRFGRHGDIGVHQPGGPFKNPVLLADTGAVLAPAQDIDLDSPFTGQGLGRNGALSRTIRETVHQGYAPVLNIRL